MLTSNMQPQWVEKAKFAGHLDGQKLYAGMEEEQVGIVKGRGRQRWKHGGWATSPFIFGCEAAERLATAGSVANLIMLVQQMHQKSSTAAANLNIFSGLSTLTPLLGAFLADAYLGRYKTIVIGSFVYLLGLLTLVLVAIDGTLRPRPCSAAEVGASASAAGHNRHDQGSTSCQLASSLQIGIVYLSFVVTALGSGGIRPCVSPFGASQFDQSDVREKTQLKHYFNWFDFDPDDVHSPNIWVEF